MLCYVALVLLRLPSAAAAASSVRFSCGEGCIGRIDAWCDDAVRIRMFREATAPIVDTPDTGALSQQCSTTTSFGSINATAFQNGAITVDWSDGTLRFLRSGDKSVLLASEGPISAAFALTPYAPAPAPPPSPGPFVCAKSCDAAGGGGIQNHTDANACVALEKVRNTTRAQCCGLCRNHSGCAAWAWGREEADDAHRFVCFTCSGVSGTQAREDRDFGCIAGPPPAASSPSSPSPTTYWTLGARFVSDANETIVGLGQHSKVCSPPAKACGQTRLNQKGYAWSLGIKKYDIMIPFYASSRRYGFFWNAPGSGLVDLTDANATVWKSDAQQQLDFWVVAAPQGTPSPFGTIASRYADATGHAPVLPDFAMGFWQSKMRYRTSDELADVALGFAQRNLPVAVLVIDFYSWSKFGDFAFNTTCWPHAAELTALINRTGNGTRVLHSTYPWIDRMSTSWDAMITGDMVATDAATGKVALGAGCTECALTDPFSAAARAFVSSKVNANYGSHGIRMFWLDDTEPNVKTNGLKYKCGIAEACGALWSNRWVETFVEGAKKSGIKNPVMLSRAGWAGFQTTGAVLWSSDIPSTFESLRVQIRAGLSLVMSGVPWWTSDVGGFFGGDPTKPEYRELLVRWYQYGALCPIFRTHGNRIGKTPDLPTVGPRWGEPRDACTSPGGHTSGAANEPWSYGNDTFLLLRRAIELRESLRPYVRRLAQNASKHGTPTMRPLFFDFPDDKIAWRIDDEYMFGSEVLVAPILHLGARSRTVYFPGSVTWVHHFSGERYAGGTTAVVAAPMDTFPLFARAGSGYMGLE